MTLRSTGKHTASLQELRDAAAQISVAPAAVAGAALGTTTALNATFSDTEVEAVFNAHATLINELRTTVIALRAALIEDGVLADPAA